MAGICTKKEGFKFCKMVYITELTGQNAYSVPEFIKIIKNIDEMSIFHHIFHNYIEDSFNFSEYTNDFSIWASKALKDEDLAERLAAVSIDDLKDIEDIRKRILEVVETAKPSYVPEGGEFNFMKCTIGKFATGEIANNLEEFINGIEKLDARTIFYHAYLSKIIEGKMENDFSSWLRSQGLVELAETISRIEPRVQDLAMLKANLLNILRR